ncbi:DUF533 domain-containing protein [Falsiroseomonas sp. HW251]|uniref:DUF533 domain-containing protein n=1 Tax=Falsiroseomonas sp. HW251 TaxID=3390998 RepID=UPI003D3242CB
MPQDPPPADRVLHAAIATKLLHAWAQNRQQVLAPLTLDLSRMESGPRALLLGMVAAAQAVGGKDGDRLRGALRRMRAEGAAIPGPPDLFPLLHEIEAAALGAQAYAAAALLLDRRVAAERAFLDWIAARFALPASAVAALARRYGR